MLSFPRQVLRSQCATPIAVVGVATCVGIYSYSRYSTQSSPQKVFGGGPTLTYLKLHSVETLSHDTKRFRFSLPSEDAVSGLSLTSAVLTLSRPNGQFRPVIRPYTPISDLNEPGFLDLAVKKYSDGKASTHIHSLIPGDSLFFLGSIKAYPWKTNEFQHITLIAGGAGITPLYQLTSSILSNPQEKTAITLVFGINSDRDALFRNEFSEWEKKFPDRFKVVYTVSNPGPNSPFPKGYVTKELLENLVGKKGSEKVFVCGPPGLEKALMGGRGNQGGILNELGFEKEQIYKF